MTAAQSQPAAVLVLRFSAVGDVVLASGAVAALARAWPDSRIIFAVKEPLVPLLANDPNIHQVVGLQKGEGALAFAKRLRPFGCEVLLDLHDKIRSRLLRCVLPGRSSVWRKRSWYVELPVRLGLSTFRAPSTIAERYHRAVEQLVGRELPRQPLAFYLAEQHQQEIEQKLGAAGVDLSQPVLGVSPGTNWTTKQWPVDRYAALAERAVSAGMQVVLVGSPGEAGLGAQIATSVPRAFDLTGQVPLAQLGAFIDRCSAFVANDSGPMHIARALGVPTLAIFGSTDPGQFDFTGHSLMFAGVSCAPCHFYGRRRCPKGHFACMDQLTVDQAWQALQPLLDGQRRAGVVA